VYVVTFVIKHMRKKIGFGLFLFSVLFLGIGIWLWNKPHRNLSEETAAFSGTPDELFNRISSLNDSGRLALVNSTVELQGAVQEFSKTDDSTATVKLVSSKTDVICTFNSTEVKRIPALMPNQTIYIRGIYTGYEEGLPGFDMLPTITLNRCILLDAATDSI
jgi:hypothetical protein